MSLGVSAAVPPSGTGTDPQGRADPGISVCSLLGASSHCPFRDGEMKPRWSQRKTLHRAGETLVPPHHGSPLFWNSLRM